MLRRSLLSISALALLGTGSFAQAQTTYFPSNATINYAVSGNARVGYANQADYNNRINPTSPTVNLISGGSISSLYAYNSSSVNMSNGSGVNTVQANDTSTVNINGGSVQVFLHAFNFSMVTISGGSVGGSLSAFNSSTVTMSGGSFLGGFGDYLEARNNSTVTMSGGNIPGNLYAVESGVLNFFGWDLVASLFNPNENGFSRYLLSGKLRDGTVLTNKDLYVQNGSNAHFTLNNVPAPGSLMVALIGVVPGVLLLRRRRK